MEFLSSFGTFANTVFGFHPEQLVEEEALVSSVAVGIKKGGVSKAEAQEIIKTNRAAIERGTELTDKQDASITLLPSDTKISSKEVKVQENSTISYDSSRNTENTDKKRRTDRERTE